MNSRRSVQATYDSRQTGTAYHVTYRVNGKTVTFREPIGDPFLRGSIVVGWRDLLWSLFRGRLIAEVIVGGDRDRMNDVLELDANALLTHSSRRQQFDEQIQEVVGQL